MLNLSHEFVILSLLKGLKVQKIHAKCLNFRQIQRQKQSYKFAQRGCPRKKLNPLSRIFSFGSKRFASFSTLFLQSAFLVGTFKVACLNTHPQTPSAREGAFYALRYAQYDKAWCFLPFQHFSKKNHFNPKIPLQNRLFHAFLKPKAPYNHPTQTRANSFLFFSQIHLKSRFLKRLCKNRA